MTQNTEENTKSFWNIYDEYIQTENKELRPEISNLLRKIEKSDKATQLLRPEKGWNQILAWQVLRKQGFAYLSPSFLFEGEVLMWASNRKCDIFLTRIPPAEIPAGLILRPGFKLNHGDKSEMSLSEWEQEFTKYGINDERGLYLPFYEFSTVEKFCFSRLNEARESVIDYLKKMYNNK